MISEKELYTPYKSKFTESANQVLFYRGFYIFDVNHSVERYNERVGKDIFLYEKLLKKGINWIIENKKEWVEDQYIFISKKYRFGIQVYWREDNQHKIKGMNGWSTTTLSDNEMNYFRDNDKKLFLENIQKDETYEKAKEIFERGYSRFDFNGELKKELYECMIEKYVQSGQIYYSNVKFVEL